MKNIRIIVPLVFLIGFCLFGCEKVEVNPVSYTKSNITEVRMYNRQIVSDHASTIDMTISSTVNESTHQAIVVVKPAADLTNLYGIAKLSEGCTITPVGDAPDFGKVADFSKTYKYLVDSPNGDPVEWTVSVSK